MSQTAVETADIGQALRDLVEEILRNRYLGANRRGKLNDWTPSQQTAAGLTQWVDQEARKRRLPTSSEPLFWSVVTEHIWTLARVGALALLPRDPTIEVGTAFQAFQVFPSFVITDFGYRLLTEPDISPHDWAKYQTTVRIKVPSPDDIVMVHLGESVGAWKTGLYRASAVMLGCAVERLIVVLAETMRDASLPAPADRLAKMLSDPNVGVSKLFDVVHDVLEHLSEDRKLPGDLADTWERRLPPAFEHTRIMRNKSGHPTGAEVTREDAYSGLLLFPGVYELVDKLVGVIRAKGQ